MGSLAEFLIWQLRHLERVTNSLACAEGKSSGKARQYLASAISEIQIARRRVEEAKEIMESKHAPAEQKGGE